MSTIRIAIADDHQLFRQGIRMVLDTVEEFELVSEASNGQELLERIAFDKPDLVLLDVEMSEMGGKEALKTLRAKHPQIKVIMLTMHAHEEHMVYFLSNGAGAYLLKDTSKEELTLAIKQVVKEGQYLTGASSRALIHRIHPDDSSPPELSEREKDVLRLICEEKTTAEIADELFLSPRTVETYRKQLLEKTHSKNIAGLVKYAMERKGLI